MIVQPLAIRANERLLVFAPHPDDESLACGGLIQSALDAGAAVCVVIVTDGASNPWPQRVAEKRWRIGTTEIQRWGTLRCNEANAALQALGVGPDETTFLHWEDQGLTARLMEQPRQSVADLRALISRFKPTLITMPDERDSHPDHSALALMLRAAIRAEAASARCVSYWLHGRPRAFESQIELALTDGQTSGKRSAALSHASQTRFGVSRLLRFVTPTECFEEDPAFQLSGESTWQWRFRLPLVHPAIKSLRVVGIAHDGSIRVATLSMERLQSGSLRATRRFRQWDIEIDALWPEPMWVVAKLDVDRSIYVYDCVPWMASLAGQHPAAVQTAHGTQTAVELQHDYERA